MKSSGAEAGEGLGVVRGGEAAMTSTEVKKPDVAKKSTGTVIGGTTTQNGLAPDAAGHPGQCFTGPG